jgi:diguanylate cyclase (GGDEF)-like protein/PAS domain S-box-containing protein
MVFRKNPLEHEALRQLARARLSGRGGPLAPDGSDQQQIAHLLEELETHQIELELQNEHLNAARTQLEQALNHSNELYDFAPMGSVLVNADGDITRLNLAAAQLLGAERALLLGQRFGIYVVASQRSQFNALLIQARDEREPKTAEFTLQINELGSLPVQLRAVWIGQQVGWQIALIDISERQRMEEQLRASEERLTLALEAVGDGVWDWQVGSGEVLFSDGFARLFEESRESLGHQMSELMDYVDPADRQQLLLVLHECVNAKRDRYHIEYRLKLKDGSSKWVLARGAVVQRSAHGKALRVVGTLVDVTHNKKTQAELAAGARFQQAVFDATSAHIAVLDHSGVIVQTNAAWHNFVSALGFPECVGRKYLAVLADLFVVEKAALEPMAQGLAAVASGDIPDFRVPEPLQCQCRKFWFSAKITPVRDQAQRMVATHEDVTVLKQAELASVARANVDGLTGALSRQHFMHLADQEMARAKRYQLPLVVLMLDLDHFKNVNDSYGHPAGDAVLRSLVDTVKGVLRESDVVGRIGGEEFAVLLPNTTQEGGRALADRIIDAVRARPVAFEAQQLDYTVSIGATSLGHQASFGELLAECDVALYRAKRRGRDRLEMSWDKTRPKPAGSPHPVGG